MSWPYLSHDEEGTHVGEGRETLKSGGHFVNDWASSKFPELFHEHNGADILKSFLEAFFGVGVAIFISRLLECGGHATL